jgi:hypothetical protein
MRKEKEEKKEKEGKEKIVRNIYISNKLWSYFK